MTSTDAVFMARALELALSAPFTSPNPRVGAVLVREGRVVSEGVHRGAGTPHAEADALEGVDARGTTLYVNLEPCDHQGRMPPCAPRLVDAGVARVVAAIADPDPRVAGAGFERLRAAGVDVVVGVLREDAEWTNAAFLHQRRTGRAYLTLKLALTLDGRLAAPDGSSRWVTGAEARRHVHRRRLEADAVMVGSGTVLADDPSLTVREVEAARQPVAVVVDSTGSVSSGARIFSRLGGVVVATTDACPHERQVAYKEAGAEVLVLPGSPEGVALDALLQEMGRRGFLEVYCEGGARLATSLLRAGLVQRLEVHQGGVMTGVGGASIADLAVSGMEDAPRWRPVESRQTGADVLSVWVPA